MKPIFINFITFLFLMILSSSCNKNKNENIKVKSNQYFDLKDWIIHTNQNTLKRKNFDFQKSTFVNGIKSQSIEKNSQWISQLNFLHKYNINKTEFTGLYRQISAASDSSYIVTYVPYKKNIFHSNRMKLIFNKNNKLKEIKIIDKTNTGVYNAMQYVSLSYDTSMQTLLNAKIENKSAFLFISTDSTAVVFNQIISK